MRDDGASGIVAKVPDEPLQPGILAVRDDPHDGRDHPHACALLPGRFWREPEHDA